MPPITCSRQYEAIIATLCENLDVLDEPEAKAAMIWIVGVSYLLVPSLSLSLSITPPPSSFLLPPSLSSPTPSLAHAPWILNAGEYAERIDNADELLDSFLETFADECLQVQLQLLTGIVKLFLKRPAGTQELVQKVRVEPLCSCPVPCIRTVLPLPFSWVS